MLGLVPRTDSWLVRQPQASAQAPQLYMEFASLGSSGTTFREIWNQAKLSELQARYGTNVWVFAAVFHRAQSQAMIPLRVYQQRRDGKEERVMEDHPLQELLDRVNDFSTQADLIEASSIQLDLTGNDYWLFFGGGAGKQPVEIWPLDPEWVTIIPSSTEFIRGYAVRPNGVGEPYLFDPIARALNGTGVMHLRTPNPKSVYYGQGAMKPALASVLTSEAATGYRLQFYQNSGRPDGVLSTEKPLTDVTVEIMKERWREQMGTRQGRAHSIAILDNALKYQAISATPKDSDVVADSMKSREDILAAWGVSLAVLGIEVGDVGRRAEQLKHYYEDRIKPACLRRARAITEFVAPLYGQGLVVKPDFSGVVALQEDKLLKAQIEQIYLASGVLTVNEVRETMGKDPVAWGDAPPQAQPATPFDPSLLELDEVAIYKAAGEATMERQVGEALRLAIQAAADAVANSSVGNPLSQAVAEMERVARPLLEKILADRLPGAFRYGWALAKKKVGASAKAFRKEAAGEIIGAFDLEQPLLRTYIQSRPVQYASFVLRTVADRIKGVLTDLAGSGQPIPEIAAGLQEAVGPLSQAHATMIARTEVIGASNKAEYAAYKSADIPMKKAWLTATDEKVRPSHVRAGDQFGEGGSPGPIDLDRAFIVGGSAMMHPGDTAGPPGEVINCRCTMIPIVGEP